MFRSRQKRAATVGRRARAHERSRVWHRQPRRGTAPAEPGLDDAELSPPAGD